MGILPGAALRGGAASRPRMQADRCLNRKQNKFSCTVCAEICPAGLLPPEATEEKKWSRCIDCGLCVTACPSRCFALSAQMQNTLTDDTRPGETVLFACDQETELLDRKLVCLAGIPWELLALLSFYGEVVLYTKHCAHCEKSAWKSRLQENLKELKAFLGEERFRERVHLVESGKWKPETPTAEKELSRREVFSGLKQDLKKNLYRAAANRLPWLEETEEDALRYRRLLSHAVLEEREQGKASQRSDAETARPVYAVSLPAYTAACFGCSICERICPQKAIEIKAEANGTRLIYITPWKCTACGLCSQICPHGGLRGLQKTAVPHLEKLPLVRVKTESCEVCGTAVKPGTAPKICPACAAKRRRLRR